MAANKNFTFKADLEEANTMKRALEFYNQGIREMHGPEPIPEEDRREMGRIDTLLRREFV